MRISHCWFTKVFSTDISAQKSLLWIFALQASCAMIHCLTWNLLNVDASGNTNTWSINCQGQKSFNAYLQRILNPSTPYFSFVFIQIHIYRRWFESQTCVQLQLWWIMFIHYTMSVPHHRYHYSEKDESGIEFYFSKIYTATPIPTDAFLDSERDQLKTYKLNE